MTFVDSHMHFWDRALMPYTWLHEVPSIWDRHTPENLRQEAAGNLPDKIVFVECGAPWLEELKWVEQLASTEPRIRGIVAKATVNTGAQPPLTLLSFDNIHLSAASVIISSTNRTPITAPGLSSSAASANSPRPA